MFSQATCFVLRQVLEPCAFRLQLSASSFAVFCLSAHSAELNAPSSAPGSLNVLIILLWGLSLVIWTELLCGPHPAKCTAARETLRALVSHQLLQVLVHHWVLSSPAWFVAAPEGEMLLMFCSSQRSVHVLWSGQCADSRHVDSLGFSLTCWFCVCLYPPDTLSSLNLVLFSSLFLLSMQILFVLNSLGTIYLPKQLEAIWESNLTRDMWNFW